MKKNQIQASHRIKIVKYSKSITVSKIFVKICNNCKIYRKKSYSKLKITKNLIWSKKFRMMRKLYTY